MLYQPPFVPGATPAVPGIFNADADAAYVNGDPATATEGSYFPNCAIEHPQRELVKIITAAGITPSYTVLDQVAEGVARTASGGRVYSCTGSANAYTLAAKGAFVVPKSPFDGQIVEFVVSATNTGASTATWAGVTKAIRTWDDRALTGRELYIGRPTAAIYSPTANGAAGALLILPWAMSKAPAAFYAKTTSDQTIAASTSTVVTGWSMQDNDLVDSTLSTNTLTFGAKDAGWWVITTKLIYDFPSPGPMYSNALITRNGSEVGGGNAVGTTTIRARPTATTIQRFASGDTVQVTTAHDHSGGRDLKNASNGVLLFGFKVGS